MLRHLLRKSLFAGVLLTLILSVQVAAAQTLSGTITVLSHRTDLDQDGTLARYSEEFKALYPDLTVNWETITDYAGEVATRLNTTDYGDVLNIPPAVSPDKFPEFFSPLGTVEELGAKYNFINEGAYDGTVYGVATTGNANGLLYNKEVFEAAGITDLPTTPEEFLADLKLIKDNTDAIPLYTNYHAGWALTQWNPGIEAFSGDPDYVNLKMPHMDAPFAEGEPIYMSYKLLFDAVQNGYTEADPTTTDWEQSKNLIAQGDIAVMALGSWAIVQMQDAAEAIGKDRSIIGYMPYPTTVDGKQYAGAGGDYKIAVNKNSPNQEIAKAFLTWFLEDSNFAFDQGGIPPLIDAELPANYDAFAKAGVTYVVDTPSIAGEEGLLNNIDKEAEIGWNNGSGLWQSTVIDAARGQISESFDDLMNDANTKWAEARKALEVTP
ncbi:MAG TPA: extracellular solute-binding protein [Phototrophicaceae bacterium]|jgi:ABC-type glycerol-3-phosphate transport system substrate-binding protein|nr:extracellular solute-binding protein [Phototrophicaceae bacterium]